MITTKHKYTSYLSTEWDIILHAIPILSIEAYRNYDKVLYYIQEIKNITEQITNIFTN
jgi:hypothetical protein